jgi:hypothetical protein
MPGLFPAAQPEQSTLPSHNSLEMLLSFPLQENGGRTPVISPCLRTDTP